MAASIDLCKINNFASLDQESEVHIIVIEIIQSNQLHMIIEF
jgi:hypothetical protein